MNRDLEQIILTASDLPTIPVVATKVLQMIEDEATIGRGSCQSGFF